MIAPLNAEIVARACFALAARDRQCELEQRETALEETFAIAERFGVEAVRFALRVQAAICFEQAGEIEAENLPHGVASLDRVRRKARP